MEQSLRSKRIPLIFLERTLRISREFATEMHWLESKMPPRFCKRDVQNERDVQNFREKGVFFEHHVSFEYQIFR